MRPAIRLVGAILRSAGSIMLGLRSPHRRSCPDCWDVIGNHVEADETQHEALVRELDEELGIVPLASSLVATIGFADQADGLSTLDIFLVDRWRGRPAIRDDEHVTLGWFAPAVAARLPNLALEQYRAVFARL